jgi:hypothetical protein
MCCTLVQCKDSLPDGIHNHHRAPKELSQRLHEKQCFNLSDIYYANLLQKGQKKGTKFCKQMCGLTNNANSKAIQVHNKITRKEEGLEPTASFPILTSPVSG